MLQVTVDGERDAPRIYCKGQKKFNQELVAR